MLHRLCMINQSEQCHKDVSPCPEGYYFHNNGGTIRYECAVYEDDGETFSHSSICYGMACLG